MIKDEVTPAVTHIVNLSIGTSIFPSPWKISKVIPLHKKLDPLDPSNYRPVAILPIISKVLERIIFDQIVEYFDLNQLFHPNHHGFRAGHSTCTALLQMYDSWIEALEKDEMTGVCMLDMSAAFDVVSHRLLVDKLTLYGFDNTARSWMDSYLVGRSQCVYLDGSFSSTIPGYPKGQFLDHSAM